MAQISVVVPCYNQGEFLDECLESVLKQSFNDWECIIVNDGSLDNTKEIAEKWLRIDQRYRYLEKENGGLSSARNAGISISNSEFILPLDADDMIAPNYLELALNEFNSNAKIRVVYGKANKFGIVQCSWDLPDFSLTLLAEKNLIYCSAIYRKSSWQEVGGYDENMIYGLEDWEFWIAILKAGGEVKKIDELCFFYRVKENSMVTSMNSERIKYSIKHIEKKHYDFYHDVFGSFNELIKKQNALESHLKSRKYALRLLFKNFFGFSLFDSIFKEL